MFAAVERASLDEALEGRRRLLAPHSTGSEPFRRRPAPVLGITAMGVHEALRARQPGCDAAARRRIWRDLQRRSLACVIGMRTPGVTLCDRALRCQRLGP
jgi:hypothetical protein